MTVSHAPFCSSLPALIRVSGELCVLPVFLRQDSFGNGSHQAFNAPETSRVPSRLQFQPRASLSITGKNPFNTQ
jgi:hypothetical protein